MELPIRYQRRKALESGPESEEATVYILEQCEDGSVSRSKPEWSQNRNGSPHRGECLGSVYQVPILPSVETSEHLVLAYRTIARVCRCDIHEIYRASPIQAAHKVNFAPAKRALVVVPHDQPTRLRCWTLRLVRDPRGSLRDQLRVAAIRPRCATTDTIAANESLLERKFLENMINLFV